MLYVVAAIISGIAIVIARIVNFKLADKIGIFQGTFFNNLIGLIFSILIFFISGNIILSGHIGFTNGNILIYLGGFLGVIVVSLSSYMTPKLSAFYFTLFVFIGQLFTAIFIDYIMLDIFSIGKTVGGILVLSGLIYNLKIDSTYSSHNVCKKAVGE